MKEKEVVIRIVRRGNKVIYKGPYRETVLEIYEEEYKE